MYIYIFIYMYIYMHVHIYIYMCIYMYEYTQIYLYIYTYILYMYRTCSIVLHILAVLCMFRALWVSIKGFFGIDIGLGVFVGLFWCKYRTCSTHVGPYNSPIWQFLMCIGLFSCAYRAHVFSRALLICE